MRRTPALLITAGVVLLLLSAAAIAPHHGAVGQETTPSSGETGFSEGLTFELLAAASADELPVSPALLSVSRVTVAPGTILPIPASDPTVGLLYVEAGTLTVLLEVPAQILRGAGGTAPVPSEEEVPAGTAFTLAAGDSTLLPANVAGELRNDSDAPAVVLAVFVEPERAPGP